MKFKVTHTCDFMWDREPVEISTLEELLAFVKNAKHNVIIQEPRSEDDMWELEIYDGWRE